MAGIRAGMLALLATVVVAPAAAWGQSSDLGSRTAGPGDTVTFQIDGTDRGATWAALSSDGSELGSGEDTTDEPGTVGSFVVPDLGDEDRDIPVTISVSQGWDLSLTLEYRPPPADRNSPPQAVVPPAPAAPEGSAPPAATLAPAAPAAGDGPSQASAQPQRQGQARHRPPASLGVAGAIERVVHHLLRPSPHASRKARRRAARKARHAKHRAEKARRELGVLSRGVKPRHVEPPRDTRVDLSHGSFPGLGYKVAWQLLLGAAITALLLVAALAGLARRRAVRGRRREEDPGPLPEPVEARPLVRG